MCARVRSSHISRGCSDWGRISKTIGGEIFFLRGKYFCQRQWSGSSLDQRPTHHSQTSFEISFVCPPVFLCPSHQRWLECDKLELTTFRQQLPLHTKRHLIFSFIITIHRNINLSPSPPFFLKIGNTVLSSKRESKMKGRKWKGWGRADFFKNVDPSIFFFFLLKNISCFALHVRMRYVCVMVHSHGT